MKKSSKKTSNSNPSKSKFINDEEQENENEKENKTINEKNVVIFTGRAFQEISRDMTMQKAFMTLAYISDMMVGSEITPI